MSGSDGTASVVTQYTDAGRLSQNTVSGTSDPTGRRGSQELSSAGDRGSQDEAAAAAAAAAAAGRLHSPSGYRRAEVRNTITTINESSTASRYSAGHHSSVNSVDAESAVTFVPAPPGAAAAAAAAATAPFPAHSGTYNGGSGGHSSGSGSGHVAISLSRLQLDNIHTYNGGGGSVTYSARLPNRGSMSGLSGLPSGRSFEARAATSGGGGEGDGSQLYSNRRSSANVATRSTALRLEDHPVSTSNNNSHAVMVMTTGQHGSSYGGGLQSPTDRYPTGGGYYDVAPTPSIAPRPGALRRSVTGGLTNPDHAANAYRQIRGVSILADNALASFVNIIIKVHAENQPGGRLYKYVNHPAIRSSPLGMDGPFRISLGFGLHIGWAVEGAIGSNLKIDASYLSPSVNVTSRLESATKLYGVSLLISKSFAQCLSVEVRNLLRCIDKVKLKGVSQPIELFTLDMDMDAALQLLKNGAEEAALQLQLQLEGGGRGARGSGSNGANNGASVSFGRAVGGIPSRRDIDPDGVLGVQRVDTNNSDMTSEDSDGDGLDGPTSGPGASNAGGDGSMRGLGMDSGYNAVGGRRSRGTSGRADGKMVSAVSFMSSSTKRDRNHARSFTGVRYVRPLSEGSEAFYAPNPSQQQLLQQQQQALMQQQRSRLMSNTETGGTGAVAITVAAAGGTPLPDLITGRRNSAYAYADTTTAAAAATTDANAGVMLTAREPHMPSPMPGSGSGVASRQPTRADQAAAAATAAVTTGSHYDLSRPPTVVQFAGLTTAGSAHGSSGMALNSRAPTSGAGGAAGGAGAMSPLPLPPQLQPPPPPPALQPYTSPGSPTSADQVSDLRMLQPEESFSQDFVDNAELAIEVCLVMPRLFCWYIHTVRLHYRLIFRPRALLCVCSTTWVTTSTASPPTGPWLARTRRGAWTCAPRTARSPHCCKSLRKWQRWIRPRD